VNFLQEVFARSPAIGLPPMSYDQRGLHANATDVTLSKLNLTGISLTIPDAEHMQFTLSGMTAQLDMNLVASIIGFRRNDVITGQLSDLDFIIAFNVANGDAVMSDVSMHLGKLSINFGPNSNLTNTLIKLFLPVVRVALNTFLPSILLKKFKSTVTFQHLMTNMLKQFTNSSLPETTIGFEGYYIDIMHVTFGEVTDSKQTFSIQNGNQLVFDMAGLVGTGQLQYKYGKTGGKISEAEAKIGMFDTHINFVTEVVGDGSPGGYNLNYVSAYQNISHLSVASSSTDPLAKLLASAMQPFLKSLLEEAFTLILRVFLSL